MINTFFYIFILHKYLGVNYIFYLRKIFIPMIPTFIILILINFLITQNILHFNNIYIVLIFGIFLFIISIQETHYE